MYASGFTPFSLHVPISEAMRAQVLAPSSDPANNAFFLVSGTGLIGKRPPITLVVWVRILSEMTSAQQEVSHGWRCTNIRKFSR